MNDQPGGEPANVGINAAHSGGGTVVGRIPQLRQWPFATGYVFILTLFLRLLQGRGEFDVQELR
ncbi:MAG: hypothetical protein H6541_08910 [Lentimicrobiaceae bacterium]|nr:hypothetical protein [Lentimicrobiaceae bacterium]MCO5266874.1 hypothetical protein [Lentimicrobium sp.]